MTVSFAGKPHRSCFFSLEAIVVVSESTEKEIYQALMQFFETDMTLDFFPIPDKEEFGTADTLRLLHKKRNIKVPVLIIATLFTCIDPLKNAIL
jgi:hypothetical protein